MDTRATDSSKDQPARMDTRRRGVRGAKVHWQPLILLILEKEKPLPEQGQPPRPGKVALAYAALSIVLWLEWRLHATCRSVGRGAELVVWLPRG